MGFCEVALCNQSRLRDRVVIQTGNVPEGEGQVGGGLTVWRVEVAFLCGVLIAFDLDVERFVDGRDRASDDYVHAIAAAADNRELIFLGELEDGLIVFLAGAEAVGKLRYGDESPVGWGGGIVECFEESI